MLHAFFRVVKILAYDMYAVTTRMYKLQKHVLNQWLCKNVTIDKTNDY